MCPTRERSEIRKGVGKETRSEKKKNLKKLDVRRWYTET
jgi:hypothetical protein